MENVAADGKDEFTAREILGEALGILWTDWHVYLRWGLAALCVWAVVYWAQIVGYPFLTTGENFAVLGGGTVALLFLAIPYKVRVFRRIILDEADGTGLFSHSGKFSVWNYASGWVLLSLKAWVFGMLVITILTFMQIRVFVDLLSIESATIASTVLTLAQHFIANMVVFIVLAEQLTLLLPDIAVGGQSKTSRLEHHAGHARWTMVRIQAMLSMFPFVVLFFGLLPGAEALLRTVWGAVAFLTCEFITLVLSQVLFDVCAGIMYKRLSPEWPQMDERYRERMRELKMEAAAERL